MKLLHASLRGNQKVISIWGLEDPWFSDITLGNR